MKKPARILRANGLTYAKLASLAGQSVQYVSMQLNARRPMTNNLVRALREELSEELFNEVLRDRGVE